MTYIPVKYVILGTTLWAVESSDGVIDKYCNTKEGAEKRIKELTCLKN